MTCHYITVLDRPCGRESAGRYCEFHLVLYALDGLILQDLAYVDWANTPEFDRVRTRLIRELENT